MRLSKSDLIFDIITAVIMILVLIIVLYPLYFTLIASISDPYSVATGKVTFLPKGITFEAYKNVAKYEQVWIGYRNTILYTAFGTLFSLFLTITLSYALSKKYLVGRMAITWYFLFIMYFNGGLIPTYLIVRDLNLINKAYTLIILGSFSVFNMIVTRTFFATSIPESLYEAARIDGANEFVIFVKIALPLSKPILAVIALYYGVSRWNSFYSALVYLSDAKYMPLQIVLRSILIFNRNLGSTIETDSMESDEITTLLKLAYMAEAMKYALIIVSAVPLLIAYPFVQKYFVKGVMIGSVKG